MPRPHLAPTLGIHFSIPDPQTVPESTREAFLNAHLDAFISEFQYTHGGKLPDTIFLSAARYHDFRTYQPYLCKSDDGGKLRTLTVFPHSGKDENFCLLIKQ